jgi:methyl-accepting chemotaxis protein
MLGRFSIRQRLIAVMVVLGLLAVLLGGMGIAGLRSVNRDLREVSTNSMPSALAIDKAQMAIMRARLSLDRVTLHPESADAEKTLQRASDYLKQSDAAWAEYLALPADAQEQALAAEMTARRQDFLNLGVQPLISALRAGDKDKAVQLTMTVMVERFTQLQEAATVLTEFQSSNAQKDFASSQKNYQLQIWLTGGIGVLLVLMMVLGSVSLLRSILGPIEGLMRHFRQIAEGDLSGHIHVQGQDEMSVLLRGLQGMQDKLAVTVREVRDGASTIAVASSEIAAGNLDLSRRTENQAANIEETASSLEELTATVKHNAENAQQSNQLAREAATVAERGGQLVGQVVSTMDEIRASSTRIADIIGVIDGIAFQTNILALNAAVEAARAGEQGAALPWWRRKCAAWRTAAPMRPRISRPSSALRWSRSMPAVRWWARLAAPWWISSAASGRWPPICRKSVRPGASRSRHRTDQPGRRRSRCADPAECGAGGAGRCRVAIAERAGRTPVGGRGGIPARAVRRPAGPPGPAGARAAAGLSRGGG